MISNVLGSLFTIVLKAVIGLITFLLTPIDNLITQYLPSVNTIFSYINAFLNLIIDNIQWAVDSLCLPHAVIVIVCEYLIFKISFPVILYFIKLAIKWYNNLKL